MNPSDISLMTPIISSWLTLMNIWNNIETYIT